MKITVKNGQGRAVNPHYLFENQTEEDEENLHEAKSNLWHRKFEETVQSYPVFDTKGNPVEEYCGEAELVEGYIALGKWYYDPDRPNYARNMSIPIVMGYIIPTQPESSVEAGKEETFQNRVKEWLLKCFGEAISKDVTERNDRFLEESLELIQSLGYTADRARALVDYVFNKPIGEPYQECGGVMVTLASLCSATNLDMTANGETEYNRINTPEIIEKIRKKQASKPTGSALPQ